ncbi:MAG: GTP-binding protein, partial [Lachnospiraceae bacterium]|nr:GTP-binding protein [Lachnospiraceae bacterium]
MTKIDIISGFLGAGKTTLIKKLLKEALAGTKVVLIENEFGEIGIDGGFLKESGIEIREMNSGCICCSLVGDFGTSLKEVMEKYAPERIIIEPSGVGKLSDVMRAVQDVTDQSAALTLNSAVTVVDCTKAKVYLKNFGEFFSNQIESAGTVLLTRTDKATDEKIEEAAALVREHNPRATVITTPLQELSGQEILDTFEGNHDLEAELLKEVMAQKDEHHHHHHHHHQHEAGELIPDEEGVIVHHVFREEEHDHDHEEHEHHHDHDHEEHEHHHDHDHEE